MQRSIKKKIAAIVAVVLATLYVGPLAVMMLIIGAGGAGDVVPFFLIYALVGGAVSVGVLAAMRHRFKEIDRGEEVPLGGLNATLLEEMSALEQSGTTFQNKQNLDVRIRYVAPVVISLAVLVLLAAIIGLMICAFSMDTANSPAQVLHLMLTLALVSVTSLVMIGVLLALLRRIGKGEIDNAKKH